MYNECLWNKQWVKETHYNELTKGRLIPEILQPLVPDEKIFGGTLYMYQQIYIFNCI